MPLVLRRATPGRTPGWLTLLGYFLGICALAAIVKTTFDTYQESRQAKWPTVIATITQQSVRRSRARGRDAFGYVWYIQCGLRYRLEEEDVSSSIRSRVTSSAKEAATMRRWASQHPPGSPLTVRYSPQHHNTVALDAGEMPESGPQTPEDLRLSLLFLLPSVALITAGRLTQRGQDS